MMRRLLTNQISSFIALIVMEAVVLCSLTIMGSHLNLRCYLGGLLGFVHTPFQIGIDAVEDSFLF